MQHWRGKLNPRDKNNNKFFPNIKQAAIKDAQLYLRADTTTGDGRSNGKGC